ncbi:MAG TPA: cyclase family protein [Candidatus Saccharimonadales bacterium]|nr:cyclase family protein [Candidatus Saccharimonadales bacterium]
MPYVDLSVVINNKLPVYPGDPQVKVAEVAILAEEGYNEHSLHMGTHAGTHVDAPFHMVHGGKTLDEFPVSKFVGRGRYIRVHNGVFDLAAVKAADIAAGDIVLFHTGMSDHMDDPAYFENSPAMPEDVARYLAEKKVSMVGVDLCSPDDDPHLIHKILLKKEVLIIENLVGLGKLAGKEFKVFALPLKLAVDGAPARVIAEVENKE